MKNLILAVVFTAFSFAAVAADYDIVTQKRIQAEQDRQQFMDEIQEKQSNPNLLLNSLNQKATPQSVSFKSGVNGHYYIPATLNGRGPINFIADTGATSIYLTKSDAKAAGINLDNLNYDKTYNTANGQVKAAEITAQSIKVGGIELDNVPVSISQQQTGQSLLGMTFFGRLSHYEVKDNTLTIYK